MIYNPSESEERIVNVEEAPHIEQKAAIISSVGFMDGIMTKEVSVKKKLSDLSMAGLDTLSAATVFVYSGKAELYIAGEKVGEVEAKFNKGEAKAIDLGPSGAGIPVEGKDIEIELKAIHVRFTGKKYVVCATIIGIKE